MKKFSKMIRFFIIAWLSIVSAVAIWPEWFVLVFAQVTNDDALVMHNLDHISHSCEREEKNLQC